jgi:hypothetical protein
MTVNDLNETVRTTNVPCPRTDTAGEFPWPEPWRSSLGTRPRSEYWDVATASWHSRGPIPAPRSGD